MILEEQSRNSIKCWKENIMDDFGESSENEESRQELEHALQNVTLTHSQIQLLGTGVKATLVTTNVTKYSA